MPKLPQLHNLLSEKIDHILRIIQSHFLAEKSTAFLFIASVNIHRKEMKRIIEKKSAKKR